MEKKLLKYFLIFTVFFTCFIFSCPPGIFGDNIIPVSAQPGDLFSNNLPDYELSTSNFDNGIYTIIITSVVVLGILVFAMWKTIKSRRQL